MGEAKVGEGRDHAILSSGGSFSSSLLCAQDEGGTVCQCN